MTPPSSYSGIPRVYCAVACRQMTKLRNIRTSFGRPVYSDRHHTFLPQLFTLLSQAGSLTGTSEYLRSSSILVVLANNMRTSQSRKLVHCFYWTVYADFVGTFTLVTSEILTKLILSRDVTPCSFVEMYRFPDGQFLLKYAEQKHALIQCVDP